MKAGYLTSEFWITVVAVVASVVLCLTDKVDGQATMTAIGAAVGAYNLARGAAKINPPKDSEGPLD